MEKAHLGCSASSQTLALCKVDWASWVAVTKYGQKFVVYIEDGLPRDFLKGLFCKACQKCCSLSASRWSQCEETSNIMWILNYLIVFQSSCLWQNIVIKSAYMLWCDADWVSTMYSFFFLVFGLQRQFWQTQHHLATLEITPTLPP